MYFRIENNQVLPGAFTQYYDKVPLKFSGHDASRFASDGYRVVPPAVVRKGAYIGANVVLRNASIADGDIIANADVAFDQQINIQEHIPATLKTTADVDAGGVGQGRATSHQLLR